MKLFKRSELIAKLLEDVELELEVETNMYNDGIISDYSKVAFLTAQLEHLNEIYIETDDVCVAVEGVRI